MSRGMAPWYLQNLHDASVLLQILEDLDTWDVEIDRHQKVTLKFDDGTGLRSNMLFPGPATGLRG